MLAASPAVHSASLTVDARLGDVDITLLVPAGFGAPAQAPRQIVEVMTNNLPAANHLLGIMVSQDDLDRIARGVNPTMSRYFTLMSVRSLEQDAITAAHFEQLKSVLRQQGNDALKEMQKRYASNIDGMGRDAGRISGDSAVSMKLQAGDMLGVFDEHPNSIALAYMSTVSLGSRKGLETIPLVTASGYVLLRGRPVNVNAYAEFHSKADIEWAEAQVRDWMRRTTELNAAATPR